MIAAEIEVGQLTKLNHDRNPEDLKEGQTILLPAGKLSFRDKEILAGIGSGNYRTYPVRKSETIEDIISKRNITRAEVDVLNQGVNLNKLTGARATVYMGFLAHTAEIDRITVRQGPLYRLCDYCYRISAAL